MKKWRLELGLNQTQAGRAIGIGQSFVSSIETETKDPSIEVLIFIHRFTKISIYELLDLPEPEK